MNNPLTGQEVQKKTISEIFGLDLKQKKQPNNLSQYTLLKKEIDALKAENAAYKNAFAEIASSETNSIAKIRDIAKEVVSKTRRY